MHTYRYRFRPRVLRDVSKVDICVKIQGDEVGSPIGVAPTAMQKMAHIEGEAATAQGNGSCLVAVVTVAN